MLQALLPRRMRGRRQRRHVGSRRIMGQAQQRLGQRRRCRLLLLLARLPLLLGLLAPLRHLGAAGTHGWLHRRRRGRSAAGGVNAASRAAAVARQLRLESAVVPARLQTCTSDHSQASSDASGQAAGVCERASSLEACPDGGGRSSGSCGCRERGMAADGLHQRHGAAAIANAGWRCTDVQTPGSPVCRACTVIVATAPGVRGHRAAAKKTKQRAKRRCCVANQLRWCRHRSGACCTPQRPKGRCPRPRLPPAACRRHLAAWNDQRGWANGCPWHWECVIEWPALFLMLCRSPGSNANPWHLGSSAHQPPTWTRSMCCATAARSGSRKTHGRWACHSACKRCAISMGRSWCSLSCYPTQTDHTTRLPLLAAIAGSHCRRRCRSASRCTCATAPPLVVCGSLWVCGPVCGHNSMQIH